MFRTNWARWARITFMLLMVAATLAALIATAAPSQARPSGPDDPGAEYERKIQDQTEKLFGFERPVPSAATTPSSTAPGPQAITIAKGLTAGLVSDRVGENADMIALWPNDENPTYAII